MGRRKLSASWRRGGESGAELGLPAMETATESPAVKKQIKTALRILDAFRFLKCRNKEPNLRRCIEISTQKSAGNTTNKFSFFLRILVRGKIPKSCNKALKFTSFKGMVDG